MKIVLAIISTLTISQALFSQGSILESYIETGIENNLALKQLNYSYEESLYALQEARGYFYPNISLNARASVAEGGRTIEFPVGDMLNPVYNTLNELTASNDFPTIENEEIEFMRPFEHDTRVSLVQPLFNPSIYYHAKIQKALSTSSGIDRNIYKRNLVADIKEAYMNYLKSIKWTELLDDSKKLTEENIRVNTSLYKNNKVTIDYIYRSEAELSKLEQQQAEAEKSQQIAQRYFNFLLNQPLTTEIEVDTTIGNRVPALPGSADINAAIERRSEIDLIQSYQEANAYSQKLYTSNYLPSLALAANYGFQGDEYTFDSRSDYAMVSLAFRWNLFSGMQRKAQLQQSKVQGLSLNEKQTEVKKRIELQIHAAYLDLIASQKAISAAGKQQQSAKQTFKLVNKKYTAGQLNLLEYLDAQTTLINARENYWLEVYNYYIKLANYEREIEMYN